MIAPARPARKARPAVDESRIARASLFVRPRGGLPRAWIAAGLVGGERGDSGSLAAPFVLAHAAAGRTPPAPLSPCPPLASP